MGANKMSEVVFPSLIGQEWPVNKKPAFNNIIQKSPTNKRKALALTSYPLWTFKVSYAFLSDNGTQHDDIHTLMGFFLQRQGNFDDFLFNDQTDNFAQSQLIGVGDGAATHYQLARSYGGFIEPVFAVKGTPIITIEGVATTAFTVTSKGMVVFTTPPPLYSKIRATFGFYFRVAFTQPESEFNNFMQGLWENKSLEFETVK